MASLRDYFSISTNGTRAALYGIGGVGKTQCAVNYCHSVKGDVHVLWVLAHRVSALKASFNKIADTLGLLKSIDPVKSVHEWLQGCRNSLVVFDNVDNINIVQPYLPREESHPFGKSQAVLLTTRDSAIVESETVPFGTEVNLFDTKDAIRLFMLNLNSWTPTQHDQIRTKMEDFTANSAVQRILNEKFGFTNITQLEKIAELTGRLPLAIVQCASYLRQYPTSYPDYIRKFQASTHKSRQRFLSHSPKGAQYSESIMTTWEISFEHIVQDLPGAGELLTMFGFLDRIGISMDLTESALTGLRFWQEKCVITPAADLRAKFHFLDFVGDYIDNLGLLQSLSLISQDPKKRQISMHPLVHEWTHLRLQGSRCAEWLIAVIRVLYHRLPPLIYSANDRSVPHQAEIVLCHTERCKELVGLYIEDILNCCPEVAMFFLESYLWYHGQDHLDVVEKLVARVREEDRNWVMKLLCGARLHQIVQDFQGSISGILDEVQYHRYSTSLTLLSKDNNTAPVGTRFVLTEATVTHRLGELLERDMRVPLHDIVHLDVHTRREQGTSSATTEAVTISAAQIAARLKPQATAANKTVKLLRNQPGT
ncbi:hypothetical protein EPUS_08425 [Endocarpon pusillum Z07020]|uniref:NB-ARC domain-containing protein n=1 Tax=Endocarpon pusillum (strain Z07020 / HMAS-L-300199) TaxID=1263415 RepID=U1GJM2_ENDPU|nr:uncharacterized protein EPUS_08425 [Endocarpon pusillum Z07020]ERF72031.1 hypothetical protein EPUS_08425 [Endocarpon pusillum Z07020]